MKMSNGERAFVDMVKLREYCLSPHHPEGKHKARVFQSVLNMGAGDAEWLRDLLIQAAAKLPCVHGHHTEHGQRYVIDFRVDRDGRTGTLRSAWIIRQGEDFPRLVSCYVL
jgi:hypothetical protein